MKNIFLIADTHFGDQKLCDIQFFNGEKYRPWDKASDMDEALIGNWNKVVGRNDIVYHLGDVAVQKEKIRLLAKCNGVKILIKGNRDNFELFNYVAYFSDVKSSYVIDKFILSHIPLFHACIKNGMVNIHGHLHRQEIKNNKYLNVSVEKINYRPISVDEIKIKLDRDKMYSLFAN